MPIFDPRPWTYAWACDDAPATPGTWPNYTGGVNLALTGTYASAQETPEWAADAVGAARVNNAIRLNAIQNSGFAATGISVPAGDFVLRVATQYTTRPGLRMIAQVGTAGANYIWVWNAAGMIQARIFDGSGSTTVTVAASTMAADGWGDGSPLLVDVATIGADRILGVNGRFATVAAGAFGGTSTSDIRVGIRSAGETNDEPIIWVGLAVGADAAWWSQGLHSADVAEGLWGPTTPARILAQATRADLFSRVRNWLRRNGDTDLDADLPFILRNAEARLAREVVHSSQVVVATLELAGRSAALPADCLELRSITKQGSRSRKLELVTPEVLRESTLWDASGDPGYYAVERRDVYFAPAASVDTPVTLDISYFARFDPLQEDGDTNYLLSNHFDLYLYAVLAEACIFLQDERLALQFEAKYVDIRRRLIEQDGDFRHSGSVVRRTGSQFIV